MDNYPSAMNSNSSSQKRKRASGATTEWPVRASRLDEAAIEHLYDQFRAHAKWLDAPARLPYHDWEDVVQDCLCRLLTSDTELRDEHHLMATFHTMLKHRIIDLQRMRLANKRLCTGIEEVYDDGSHQRRKASLSPIVHDLLATLEPDELRLAFARFYEKRSLRDIAKRQGASISTIHRRLLLIFSKLAALDER